MKKVLATWEKRNLGVNAAEINLDDNDVDENLLLKNNIFDELDAFINENNIKYVTVKFPSHLNTLHFPLQKKGYIYAETQIVFELNLKKFDPNNFKSLDRSDFYCKEFDLKSAESKNIIDLIRDDISSGIFATDRFSLDEKFGIKVSSLRYVNWFNDMINGDYHLFVTFDKDDPIGFVVIGGKDGAIGGGVGGLFKKHQNSGMGLFWAFHLAKYLKNEYSYYKPIGCSCNNIKVVKMWSYLGAQVQMFNNVYYKHL